MGTNSHPFISRGDCGTDEHSYGSGVHPDRGSADEYCGAHDGTRHTNGGAANPDAHSSADIHPHDRANLYPNAHT
jgi:hypothetical protein